MNRLLNGFFCAKRTSYEAEGGAEWLGEGICLGFVWKAGIQNGHRFSRALFGTSQCALEDSLVFRCKVFTTLLKGGSAESHYSPL